MAFTSSARREFERQLRGALAAEVARVGGRINEAALARAIENGDYERATREAGLTQRTLYALVAAVYAVLLRAVTTAARAELDPREVPLLPGATADWAEDESFTAATLMFSRAKDTFNGILARGAVVGLTAAELARRVKSWTWLLDSHAAGLEAQAQRMAEEGMADGVIWRTLRRIAAVRLLWRLSQIAASEITTAKIKGSRLAWAILISEGLLDPTAIRIRWVTAFDEMVCPRCAPMHGVTIRYDEEFSEGPPPLHTSCRCDEELVIL